MELHLNNVTPAFIYNTDIFKCCTALRYFTEVSVCLPLFINNYASPP